MVRIILRVIVYSFLFYAAALLFPKIEINGYMPTLFAATMLIFFNYTLKPVLVILTSPFILVTFGLFIFVVNAWMVMLVDAVVKGIRIPGFWLSLVIAVFVMISDKFIKKITDYQL